ncbi:MAG: PD-(D/E)XK nuclease family protein [Candidatus Saccharicenans sp.]|jgi:CRISPR/Cas system-associated exonuclease Cas4 (RecB family)|nr:PD-(D/E)XK nuclease family protein [Candidatus Saccharicenans sp.]MDH7575900.1 PD-(D/E)XK nuclease family protein [Candidatus Saccharicenans sp.]
MSLVLVSPGHDLPELLASRLLESGQDLTRIQVIFPEKRPGHYLRKALARRLGRSFLPPAILSFDELVDNLYLEINQDPDRPAEPIDAVSILYELHRKHPEPLGGQAFLSLDEFFPLGTKLYQDLEELKAGLVSRENFLMIDSLSGQKLPDRTRNRLQKVSFFFENFYKSLAEEGLSTPATRLIKVLEALKPEHLDCFEQTILAGFFLLNRGEMELVKRLLESDRVTFYLLEGPGLEDMVQGLGLDLKEAETISDEPGKAREPELQFYQSPDSHGQLFILNKLMEDRFQNPALLNEKQVIVLPALESLIPLHQQTLTAIPEETYNISLGYPLTRTPLYNFFDCLFNLIQTADDRNRFYASYYLDFVLHPYTKNIYFEGPERSAELTRILFHTIQEIFTRNKGRLFWSLEEIASDRDLSQMLDDYSETAGTPRAPEFLKHLRSIHQRTIEPFLKINSLEDFAGKLIDLLHYLANQSTAPLHLFFQPYAEAFFEQFEKLKGSLLARHSFEHRNSYFNLFRKLISEARVSFPGTPLHGLQVLGFWETRCLQFDEVYLLDMNEEVIPGTSRVDSLLPQLVRQALKLPTYRDLEKRYRYYFHQLVSGAKKVNVFFVENSEKEKSRFVEELLWKKQKKEGKLETSGYIQPASYRIDLRMPAVQPVAKTPAMVRALEAMEISATQLDSYLRCPLQFFYAHVLGLAEREELSDTPERAEIGTLVHSILQEYFQSYLKRPLPAEPDADRLLQIIDQSFGQKFSDPDSGLSLLIKEQVKKHLLEFLESYQKPAVLKLKEAKKRLVILGLEKKYRLDYTVNRRTFRLKGKIDRIEKRGSQLCLLDYKTSSKEDYQAIKFKKLDPQDRSTWAGAIGSLQLPFYQLLAAPEFRVPPEDIYSGLLLLGKNYLDLSIEFSPLAEKSTDKSEQEKQKSTIYPLNETDAAWEMRKEKFFLIKEIIDELLKEIIDPTVPFTPDGLDNDQCQWCSFKVFCGQQ